MTAIRPLATALATVLATCVAATLLTACATPAPSASLGFDRNFPLPVGQGAIVVYRQGNGFASLTAAVMVDGKSPASLARNEHAVIPLAAGEHLLQQRWVLTNKEPTTTTRINGTPAELRFTLDSGEKRFLRLTVSTDRLTEDVAELRTDVTWRLQEMPADVALGELAQTRPAAPAPAGR
ncbi:hypothetical protein [Uliginosibacterium sp. H1]|uniref:hypothetical protein n=1 Tax=Uliginosibacterium sp. H1 TaxID=3114757 RepID=UPI002E18DEC9|nr:hypothetical protein [Uliginosibacterium sp. H1]